MRLEVPVIGILRGIAHDFFGPVMGAAFEAGLQAIEVTFNTDRAEEILRSHRPLVPPGKLLGMGTIRNLDEARKAVAAGAMFLVTPNTDVEVIRYAVSQGVPIIAGAFTPSEVYAAWSAGAQMVKVFPCGSIGPQYIRELRGPFDHIPLVAVGGVRQDNVKSYFEAGARAVGVGDSLFGPQALKQRSAQEIGLNVKKFLRAALQ
ncbi:MAG: bifunctional 4-hydroxy-2-oxoglutarate aldolase/2-dehydro-3-deoxy-phosphogluconate aldolase [Desulfobacteraceae bacterium]|nr:bifunctional 4-hydroxy-2-oxoglutarate aldolase/2-dehydro-3-deoxy-phosphogluconate aldolase [Desulfobacteraceae bacterium]